MWTSVNQILTKWRIIFFESTIAGGIINRYREQNIDIPVGESYKKDEAERRNQRALTRR